MSNPGFHAGHGHVQAVGHEAQNGAQGSKVRQVRVDADLLKAQHRQRNHKGKGQLDPQEIGLVAGLEDVHEYVAMDVILQPQQRHYPQSHVERAESSVMTERSRPRPKARALIVDSKIVIASPQIMAEMKKKDGCAGVYQNGCIFSGKIRKREPSELW